MLIIRSIVNMLSFSNLNQTLGRADLMQEIVDILINFETNYSNVTKKGIYIHGPPGCGKTSFVKSILKKLEYDTILYDAGDVRNKALFQNIDHNHVSNRNVLDLMRRKPRKIAIVMDEIDGMNNGDKGGIDALIKLIRQKKTKKQRTENTTSNPIICIGSNENDKKIRELMKACYIFELKPPTSYQMATLLEDLLPPFHNWKHEFKNNVLQYLQGDLRKMLSLYNLWEHKPHMLCPETLNKIFHIKMYNEDSKKIAWKLLHNSVPLEEHNLFMNETDRTTVALLWHENIGTMLSQYKCEQFLPFYNQLLDNMCFADYIGRITFQSQIWQFNEMTSLIKTFHNNFLFHKSFKSSAKNLPLEKIDFTKVLTKYSTEYNNQMFIQNMSQKMNMDKKDLIAFFYEVRSRYGDLTNVTSINIQITEQLQRYQIDTLDIRRIYRFLDKNVKKDDDYVEDDEE